MLKVIVADDNADVRRGLKELVPWGDLGAELVLCAHDGKEVMDFMNEQAVDLVISDIKMPTVNGIELCRHISTLYPGTMVVILSAYADFEFAQEALHYGVSEYILKPIDSKKLQKLKGIISSQAEKRQHSTDLGLMLQAKDYKDQILQTIREMNPEGLRGLFNSVDSYQKAEFPAIKEFYQIILGHILHTAAELGVELDEMEIRASFIRKNGVVELKKLLMDTYVNMLSRLKRHDGRKANLGDEILRFIDDNFTERNLNVAAIAEHFKLSATYVGVTFKNLTSQTLSEYIYTKRMERARELLKKTDLSISAISGLVGYEDRDYFARVFKKYTGSTPSEYRQS